MSHIEALQACRPALKKVLRLPAVKGVTALSRSTIYAKIAEGTFPKPIPLSGRAVGWLEEDIVDWQQARIAERDRKIA